MASRRSAFRLSPVIRQGVLPATLKLSCVAHYGGRVVLGTQDGRVLLYEIIAGASPSGGESKSGLSYGASEVAARTISGRRAVDQILVIEDIGRLVVLCGGQVSVHELSSLRPVPSAITVKGVGALCMDERGPPEFGLCAGTRRKIHLYEWSRGQYTLAKEFSLPDTPVSLAWFDCTICVGYRREYHILNADTGAATDVHISLDASSRPVAKLLPSADAAGPPTLLLAGIERVGIVIDLKAAPAGSTLCWDAPLLGNPANAPGGLLVSLVEGEMLEVHAYADMPVAIQQIHVPRASAMADTPLWRHRRVTAQKSLPLLGLGSNAVLVAQSCPAAVCCLEPLPVREQVVQMLNDGHVQEAFALLRTILPDDDPAEYARQERNFHVGAAVVLLRALELDRGFHHLEEAMVDPRELLAFFPELQSPGFAYAPAILRPIVLFKGVSVSGDESHTFRSLVRAGLRQRSLDAKKSAAATSMALPAAVPEPSQRTTLIRWSEMPFETQVELNMIETYGCLVRFLERTDQRCRRRRGGLNDDVPSLRGGALARPVQHLTGGTDDVGHDEEGFCLRTPVSDSRLRQAIDNALLRAYVLLAKGLPGRHKQGGGSSDNTAMTSASTSRDPVAVTAKLDQLASRATNHCDLASSISLLSRHGLHHTVALLHESRGERRAALEVWAKLGSGELFEPGHDGVEPTILALAQDSNAEHVWVFSSWVLREYPERAMAIFTGRHISPHTTAIDEDASKDECTCRDESSSLLVKRRKSLSPERVLEHLQAFSTNRSASSTLLGVCFLEYLVGADVARAAALQRVGMSSAEAEINMGEEPQPPACEQKYHTQLALLYVQALLEFGLIVPKSKPPVQNGETLSSHLRERFLFYLKWVHARFDVDVTLRALNEASSEAGQQSSAAADEGILTGRNHALVEERVALLQRLGDHLEALRALILAEGGLVAAERYCIDHCSVGARSDDDGDGNPFVILIRICLGHELDNSLKTSSLDLRSSALKLLRRHAKKMDASSVLRMLPEDMVLQDIEGYLAQMMQHAVHQHRDRQLVRRLCAAENLQVKHELMQRKAIYCTVTGDSRCSECNKRIMDRVFALTPDAELVHYSCLDATQKYRAL